MCKPELRAIAHSQIVKNMETFDEYGFRRPLRAKNALHDQLLPATEQEQHSKRYAGIGGAFHRKRRANNDKLLLKVACLFAISSLVLNVILWLLLVGQRDAQLFDKFQ